jgi:uncharacterized membrane protein YtjA (UPF0391 family)
VPADSRGELRADRIIETVERLQQRIEERFPGSGLGQVCGELRRLAGTTQRSVPVLRRPIWPLRMAAVLGAIGLVAAAAWLAVSIFRVSTEVGNASEVLQGTDAALNDVIFLSLAIFFLVSLETRVKRRRVLRALQRLRSIVHIVDMHQLTKDPERLRSSFTPTAASVAMDLDTDQLEHYLDYCSELLSLIGKAAALCAEESRDAVVLDTVSTVETLTVSLERKIWQKIAVLDHARQAAPES